MKVRNLPNTSGKTCNCGTWIDHWVRHSKRPKPKFCATIGCMEISVVGAHVKKVSMFDTADYIAPLCQSCNKTEKELVIADTTILVSATPAYTCGKS